MSRAMARAPHSANSLVSPLTTLRVRCTDYCVTDNNEVSRGAVGAGGGGGGGAAAGGRGLQQGGHQTGAEHLPHPQGCCYSEGTRRRRARSVRVHPRQPKDQLVRDPRRPAAIRSDQQPAVADRPRGPAVGLVLVDR